MKLKVKIWQIDNVVIAKIIEQDESLRGMASNYKEIIENDAYAIYSESRPDIISSLFYIRGSERDYDNKICCYDFETTEKATEWCKNITSLIEDINKAREKKKEDMFIKEWS